jgi:hypothetical protein
MAKRYQINVGMPVATTIAVIGPEQTDAGGPRVGIIKGFGIIELDNHNRPVVEVNCEIDEGDFIVEVRKDDDGNFWPITPA